MPLRSFHVRLDRTPLRFFGTADRRRKIASG
jgi:hypothetical protein